MSFNRAISLGAAVAALAFLFSILISFYSYRFLWVHADRGAFAAWLSVYELAQFLLLLDIGFTHSFIKKNIDSDWCEVIRELPALRGALFLVAMIAAVVVCICAYKVGEPANVGVSSYFYLSLSIVFTLVGYADTAALRLRNKFLNIYLINIFSNLIFMIFLHLSIVVDVVERLAIATLIRSFLQYGLQNFVLGVGLRISLPNQFTGSLEVVSLNASYFLLFLIDAFVMAALGVPLAVVASVIILKKYYDALRGLWDSTLGVLAVAFAKIDDERRNWIIRLLVVASYVCAWFFSSIIIQLWLGNRIVDPQLSAGVCVFAISLTLYRVETTRLYFQGKLGFVKPILAAIGIKLMFVGLIFASILDLKGIYLLQGILIIMTVVFMNWFRSPVLKAA